MNEVQTQTLDDTALDRRGFLRGSMAMGAGVIGAAAVRPDIALAQASGSAAPAAAAADKPLTYAAVMTKAREVMYPVCRVCPECDGVACAGEVPGMGGIGSGRAHKNNFQAMQRLQLNMRTGHNVSKPDTAFDFFGHKLSMPVMGAPTGGTTYNMGKKMTEEAYIEAVIGGCSTAGTVGSVADGIGDPIEVFERRLRKLTELGFKAIAGLKPRAQDQILLRLKKAEEAGVIAVFIDIDSAGRAARATAGQTVEPKDTAKLRELVRATKLPFMVKGVMTVEDAKIARDAGAAAIVVSNHGGRVLDYTPAPAEVLPKIVDAVGGKMMVLADGAVKYGPDALKLIALGADGALVGRHLVRAAHGGGREGVALFMNKIRQELVDSMVLTGCANVKAIDRRVIVA